MKNEEVRLHSSIFIHPFRQLLFEYLPVASRGYFINRQALQTGR